MGFWKKIKEKKQNEEEINDFKNTLGMNTDENLSQKERGKITIDNINKKNQLVQAMRQAFKRLDDDAQLKQVDMDAIDKLIDSLKRQDQVADSKATQLIDLSIQKTLTFIQKMSDEFGSVAAPRYIARLKDLISQREDPTPKYRNRKFLEMDHKCFETMVTFDALSNSLDNIKSLGARYKKEYLAAKEKGDKVRSDRLLVELQRLSDTLDAQQKEYDSLKKKQLLATKISATFALAAEKDIGIPDEEYDELEEALSDTVVDDKRINQGLDLISRYDDKLKAQNSKVSVSDSDFETSHSRSVISEAQVDDMLSKF